jgi:O-antigen/teichoic acid export membrane protein
MLTPVSEAVSSPHGILRALRVQRHRATVSNATAAVVDQALLSAVGFVVGICFIYRSSPETYGAFVLLQSTFLLLASIQNAAVNTPLMVLAPRMSPEDADRFAAGLFAGLLTWGLPASGAGVLAAHAISGEPFTPGTSLLIALCFVPLLARDGLRAREFSRSRAIDALRRDSVYAGIVICCLAALTLTSTLSVVRVYIVLAVAAAVAVVTGVRPYTVLRPSAADVSHAYRQSWAHSRWSLVGAAASWVQGNAYVYLPFYLLGASAVAMLSAARLAMMPVALLTQSWSNVQKPQLSRLLALGNAAEARRACYRGAVVLGFILIGYVATLLLALRLAPREWLPPHYQDLRLEVLMWSGIMLLQIVRNSVSWLLQASLEFEVLARFGTWTAVGTLLITAPALMAFGASGGLAGMLVAEVVLAGALVRAAHRRCGVAAAV